MSEYQISRILGLNESNGTVAWDEEAGKERKMQEAIVNFEGIEEQ